jgi:hypothetical protein
VVWPRGRSEPPIAVSSLPLRELRMLANTMAGLILKKQQHASEIILTCLAIL